MGFRYSDGTRQDVHYNFTTECLMQSRYLLSFPNENSSLEEIVKYVNLSLDKDVYGKYVKTVNNSVVRVSKYREIDFGNLEKTYYFLYGKPIECVCPKDEEEAELKEFEKPIPWSKEKVQNMDWDSFLIALYTVLCANCVFMWPEAWDIILQIVSYFPDFSDEEWERLLFGRNVDIFVDCRRVFLEELSNMLEMKVLSYVNEKTCFDAYKGLVSLKNAPINYDRLEKQCCNGFKKIALKRLEAARVEMDYKSEEIVNFEPENIFFFESLFKLKNSNDAKREIYSILTDIYSIAGTLAPLEGNEENSEIIYEKYKEYRSLSEKFQNENNNEQQQTSTFDTVEKHDFEAANKALIAMFEEELISSRTDENYVDDTDYGLVPEKPIFLDNIDEITNYIFRFCTIFEEKLRWEKTGNHYTIKDIGDVEEFASFLPSGKLYKKIYIKYGNVASSKIPKGFKII